MKGLWERLSRIARILLLCAIVGVIGIIIAIIVLASQKEYVFLDYDFNTSERTMAAAVLAEQGISCEIAANGALMVLDTDEDAARMALATAGLPGGVYESSYEPGLTSTQQDKVYLQNEELQKKLQSIIESMEEVDSAAVVISQPEKSAFALETETVPPSASVMITRKYGETLSNEQIRGILNLVRDSVAGIDEDDISITDTELGDLKAPLVSGLDVDNAKLRLTNEVSESARQRALNMLEKMYGPDNAEVEVTVVLDTDETKTETLTYNPIDPENPQNNPLDYGEHERDFLRGDDDIAEGVPGANDNIGTPQYGEEVDDTEGINDYAVHDIYDYLVGWTKQELNRNGLVITDATAAVLVNADTLPDGTREQIITMVANATGIPVENVSVHNYAFYAPEAEPATVIDGLTTGQQLGLAAILLVVLAVLIFIIIVIITKRKKKKQEELEAQLAEEEALYAEEDAFSDEDLEPITMVETTEQKLRSQIKDLAHSDPEIVASLLKNWLSSS